jgi:CheY-like chemotaxis protein
LVRAIRCDPQHRALPVILVGVEGEEARRSAYAAGANLCLDKPLLLGGLVEGLQHLLAAEVGGDEGDAAVEVVPGDVDEDGD